MWPALSDLLAREHMTSNRYMHVFTLTEPRASLGVIRRVARVCRIIFGCFLSGSLLLLSGVCVLGVLSSTSTSQVFSSVAVVPGVILLAWASGCMFIWRQVRPTARRSGGPPPEPPTEGAPCPVPLCPISPLIQSAAAELPHEQNASESLT